MLFIKRSLFFYFFIFLFSSINIAQERGQEQGQGQKKIYRGQIDVIEDKIDSFIKETTEKVEVIDRKSIRASGSTNAAEALKLHSGLDIRSDGIRGQNVRLQGFDSKHVLFLVNGVRLIGRLNGEIDLTRIKAEEIERIEIQKGSASTLYGSDAIGGVINIITRNKRSPLFIEIENQIAKSEDIYQKEPEQHHQALISFTRKKISSSFQAGIHQSLSGYDLDPPKSSQDTDKLENNGSEYLEFNIGNRNHFTLSPFVYLDFDWNYRNLTQSRVLFSSVSDSIGRLIAYDNDIEDLQFQLRPLFFFGNNTLSLTYAYSSYKDINVQNSLSKSIAEQQEKLHTVDIRLKKEIVDNHLLQIGAESLIYNTDSSRISRRNLNRYQYATFLQHEYRIPKEEVVFILLPGVRYNIDSLFDDRWTFNFSFLTHFNTEKELKLRSSVSQGYRTPSAKELYFDFDHSSLGYRVVGNEDLESENSLSYQFSLEHKPMDWLWFSFSLFQNNVRNLIEIGLPKQEGSLIVYSNQNIDLARIQGLEFVLGIRLSVYVDISFTYSYTDAIDLRRDIPLDRRAPHRFIYQLHYLHPKKKISFSIRSILSGPQVSYNRGEFEILEDEVDYSYKYPSHIIDIRLSKEWKKKYEFFIGINNILNHFHLELDPRKPRLYYIGFRYQYEKEKE